jgi:hypothetical protein
MRQSCAKTLVTEEPDEGNLHVRLCGGSAWVTGASTRSRINLYFSRLKNTKKPGQTFPQAPHSHFLGFREIYIDKRGA